MTSTLKTLAAAAALIAACCGSAPAQDRFITVASTTSTEQSGLFGYLLPRFTEASGIAVKVVAVGTGQALDIGRRGDADVVFVHDKLAEEKFLAEGFGAKRHDVMYNDFVIDRPQSRSCADRRREGRRRRPAQDRLRQGAPSSRAAIAPARMKRSCGCGKLAGIDLAAAKGDWYREIGQGMGPALNMASSSNAYLLSDRGTWLSFKNKGDLVILDQGDKRLFNQYGVMLVNPAKHPAVKAKDGQAFIDWLVSPEGTGNDRRLQGRRRAAIFPRRVQLAGKRPPDRDAQRRAGSGRGRARAAVRPCWSPARSRSSWCGCNRGCCRRR